MILRQGFFPVTLFALINLLGSSKYQFTFYVVINYIISLACVCIALAFYIFSIVFICTFARTAVKKSITIKHFGEIFSNGKFGGILRRFYLVFFLTTRLIFIIVILFL